MLIHLFNQALNKYENLQCKKNCLKITVTVLDIFMQQFMKNETYLCWIFEVRVTQNNRLKPFQL